MHPRAAALPLMLTTCLALAARSDVASAQTFDLHAPASKRGEQTIEILNGANLGSPRGSADVPRNAHEAKFVYGISDRWMIEFGALIEKPDPAEARLARVNVENIFVLKPVETLGVGLGWYTGIDIATSAETQSAIIFGPILQANAGKAEFLVNPFLEKGLGRNAEPGMALNYLWHGKYEVSHGLGLGAKGYGHIHDLASGPAFADQDHRLGPAVFLELEAEKGRHVEVSIGTLFGLTRASPSASLIFNVGIPLARR